MDKLKPIGLLVGIILGNLFPTLSQKNIQTQSQFWVRYQLRMKVNEKYQFIQDLEERTFWFPWRQHQLVSRTILERKLGKDWNTGLGLTYFLQSLPQDPDVGIAKNKSELRPQVEFAYKQTITEKLILHHRYWSEFRFFEQSDGTFDYTNNRTRYKLELRYSIQPKLSIKVFDEIMFNLGGKIVHNVFDQNRYGLSIQYMLTPNFGFEMGYINWFQQQSSGLDFYNRHIVRFTIHQSINFRKTIN